MSKIDELAEDYATRPVPIGISVDGFRIALINTALAFSLPGLLTGTQLGVSIGLKDSISAFLWGGLIVALIGIIGGLVGLRTRLSTYMIMRFSFGLQGSKLVNICMALSMFGWFGVNVYLFGQAASGLWESLTGIVLAQGVFVVFGGVLMTAGAIFGFKSIQKLAILIVPIQVVILTFLLNKVLLNTSIEQLLLLPSANQLSQSEAISAVVGSFIVAAVIMPDFTRYGRNWWDSVLASFIPYFLAATFVYFVAAIAAIWAKESDVLALMLIVGLGLSAFILIFFSSWITNSTNLYGCSLSIASIFPRFKEWQIVMVSGVIGTVIALFSILEHFIDFIFSLGVIFTPVAAIYITDYFIINKGHYDVKKATDDTGVSYIAIIAWLIGVIGAYAAEHGRFQLTSIASCDSLLIAAVTYLLLMKIKNMFLTRNI